MSVFRVNKTEDYTVMSNYHLRDKNLSLKAKGLLSVMLALPEDWDYSINGLIKIVKENETAVISTLKELKANKYLSVLKLLPNQTESGRIEYVYDVYEMPKQEGKKQDLEILGVEILDLENQGQLNTNNKILNNRDILVSNNNTNNTNTNINTNTNLDIVNNEENTLNEIELLFNTFWSEYPKKRDKQGSLKAFRRIKGVKKNFPVIMSALREQKLSKQWQNQQYIPNPTTWIHQARWEDTTDKSNYDKVREMGVGNILNVR